MIVDLVILVGWVVFWAYWLLASRSVKPGRNRWVRLAGVRVAAILVILLLVRLRVLKGHTVTHSPLLQGFGLAIFALGLALAVWARIYIGQNWGMPMSEKTDGQLVTTGPSLMLIRPTGARPRC